MRPRDALFLVRFAKNVPPTPNVLGVMLPPGQGVRAKRSSLQGKLSLLDSGPLVFERSVPFVQMWGKTDRNTAGDRLWERAGFAVAIRARHPGPATTCFMLGSFSPRFIGMVFADPALPVAAGTSVGTSQSLVTVGLSHRAQKTPAPS